MDSALDRRVSVVMCTYNGASFLSEQLETILRQTYPVYEIIVQDDGSTDRTMEILNRYKARYPRIKVYSNEGERGVNSNFFSALRRATGDYIAISDQDDLWELDKIEKQMDRIGDALLCFHYSKPFSEDGSPIAFDHRIPNYSLMRMIYFNMIPGHTMLMRKELLSMLVDERSFLYDALLALAAGVRDSIVFIPEILVNQRRYSRAYSYHAPISNARTVENVIAYVGRSLRYVIHNRNKMKAHFEAMYGLLRREYRISNTPPHSSQWSYTQLLGDTVELCGLFRECTGLSLLRASLICFKYRHSIFYTRCDDSLATYVRALLHPLLMFQYYK